MMGGRIWVESEAGRRSTFHFTARFTVPAGALALPPIRDPDRLREVPVLVVDDNGTNRRILVELATHWRMRPVAVAGGPATLVALADARAGGAPFLLVLTDAMMPEMDGYLSKPVKAEDLQAILERLLPEEAEPEGLPDIPPGDLGVVDRTVGGDRALLAELVCVFQEDGPRAPGRAVPGRGERRRRPPGAVRARREGRALHLRGGGRRAAGPGTRDAGREGRLETAAAIFARLEAELARALAFLADLPGVVAGAPPPPTSEALAAHPPPG